jgi:hypothetical protein
MTMAGLTGMINPEMDLSDKRKEFRKGFLFLIEEDYGKGQSSLYVTLAPPVKVFLIVISGRQHTRVAGILWIYSF